jgi:hypothetical protein
VDQDLKKILEVVDGEVRTVLSDGEGGIIIHSQTDLTDFAEHTKAQYNANPGKTGWSGEPLDPKNKIASLPLAIINDLNAKGIMRGFHILDPKAMKKWLNDPENRVFRTRGGEV